MEAVKGVGDSVSAPRRTERCRRNPGLLKGCPRSSNRLIRLSGSWLVGSCVRLFGTSWLVLIQGPGFGAKTLCDGFSRTRPKPEVSLGCVRSCNWNHRYFGGGCNSTGRAKPATRRKWPGACFSPSGLKLDSICFALFPQGRICGLKGHPVLMPAVHIPSGFRRTTRKPFSHQAERLRRRGSNRQFGPKPQLMGDLCQHL
jgi:hypothetical protein